MTIKEFFETDTGHKAEAFMWQLAVMAIAIAIAAANELNISWLIPAVPFLLFLTKYINTNYLK